MTSSPLTRAQVATRVRKLGPDWSIRKADTRGWLGTQDWAREPYVIRQHGPVAGNLRVFRGRSWADAWSRVEAALQETT